MGMTFFRASIGNDHNDGAAKKPNDGGASTIAAAAVVVLMCSTAIGRGDTPIDLYRSSLLRSNRIIITAPKNALPW
jgi:hypothetical protein